MSSERSIDVKIIAGKQPLATTTCGHGKLTHYNLAAGYCRHDDGTECDPVSLTGPEPKRDQCRYGMPDGWGHMSDETCTYPDGAAPGTFTYVPMARELVRRLEERPSELARLEVVRRIDGIELIAHTLSTSEQMRDEAARLLTRANELDGTVSIDAMRSAQS